MTTQIVLPVSADVIHNELEGARGILEKWIKIVGEGLPCIDTPGNPEQLDQLIRELVGELQIVSGRCDTLVEVLGSSLL